MMRSRMTDMPLVDQESDVTNSETNNTQHNSLAAGYNPRVPLYNGPGDVHSCGITKLPEGLFNVSLAVE